MDQNLVSVDLGKEGDLDLKLENGQLKVILTYKGSGGEASLSVGLTSDYFLDKLAALIPGKLDDKLIEFLKVALKN